MSAKPSAWQAEESELILLITERVARLAVERQMEFGGELALWLEAEAQVKRELCHDKPRE